MCPAILLANNSYPAGVNPNGSNIHPYDSGNIVAQNQPGKPATRLVTGLQQQATQPLQSDSTSGVTGNWIPTTSSSATVNSFVPATITNITIVTSGNISTCTFAAVNTFVVGQTVRFSGLTTVPALNDFAGVVLAAGLSGTAFECTLTQFTVPSQVSAAETGTATVNYFGKQSCLSISPTN